MRQINAAGLALIKSFESCRLHEYLDVAGLRTVGWGHLVKVGEHFGAITQQQADDLFAADLGPFERAVEATVTAPLGDNQFAACVSLAFNIGSSAFHGSGVAELLNVGHPTLAADAFLRWDKAHVHGQLVVVPGLKRRRLAERDLFLTPDASPPEAA